MEGSTYSAAQLRDLVADAGQVLYRLGLADYLGHCSARVPGTNRVVIKPKHSPTVRGMHRLGGADMVVVDLDGRLIEGADPPPAEVFIHTEIYRARSDVGAVVHTHQSYATLMGVIEAPILPVLHIPSVFVREPVPVWPCPLLVGRHMGSCGLAAGAAQTLERWRRDGGTQSLLSMWRHDELMPCVERLGVRSAFIRLDGLHDLYGAGGPKAEHLARHLAAIGIEGVDTLMVGDSIDDAAAAAHVGARAVLFSGGSHSRTALEEVGVPVIDALPEVLAHVA